MDSTQDTNTPKATVATVNRALRDREDHESGRAMGTVRYVPGIPREPLPPGHVVVHNHVRPAHPIGRNGFRAWIAAPDGDPRIGHPYAVERCGCGWAPDLAEHYRVTGAPQAAADEIRQHIARCIDLGIPPESLTGLADLAGQYERLALEPASASHEEDEG